MCDESKQHPKNRSLYTEKGVNKTQAEVEQHTPRVVWPMEGFVFAMRTLNTLGTFSLKYEIEGGTSRIEAGKQGTVSINSRTALLNKTKDAG